MWFSGDITDFVEAHPSFSTNELISKLEKAIALAIEADELQRIEREKTEQLTNLPNWSQSDLAEYLAEKYQSQLAWNTDLQQWYHYSSVRTGIWSKGSTERIGRLVKSEIGAIANQIAKSGLKLPRLQENV